MEEKSHVSYNVSEAFPDENKVVVPGVIGTSDNECEKLESPWRDSALTEIGCDSGNNGIDRIKNRSNSEWAYVLYTVPFRLC
ncbi:unnamed protein product [Rhizophagus irregularis]|nr:unnamed protein product [Rhizophagus irregularis]